MSIDFSRDGAITSKQHEIASASRSQFASLLALRAVTALVSNNGSLSSLFGADYRDPETIQNDDAQLQWIKQNSLTHGQHFDEASLPIPIIQNDPAAKHVSQHTGSDADQSLLSSTISHQAQLNDENVDSSIEKASLDRSDQDDNSSSKAFVNTQLTTNNSGLMNDIAPPEPDEQAEFNDKTKSQVDSETPKRPARTVHLPPEDVQEQRLSQRLEEVRRPSSSSNADRVHKLHNQAEAASSPSSTVGAYSAATPMPPQDSPDTSPDSETADANIPAEFRPSPIERRAKEEHDRLLEAQKAIAHQAALGDISTPDGQLRWEEREAASREAEEKAATEERKRRQSQQSSLRSVANENEKDDTAKTLPGQDAASVPEPDSQEDTIAVRAATKSKTDAARPLSSSSTVSRPFSRSHLVETGRRDSEAASAVALRRRSSLEAVSPVLPRRKLSTPKRPIFDRLQGEELDQHDLHDLDTLKGAAEDPDRDYLEPLFKIQAHDSPNINSSALPDLVRGAYKTISTEDQFTAIHERMEYRILRRIYHLQNANKWSLRQMEKCKEPPQPVSHHDHMMKEMKWMCKDFRAERKQKKSVCAWLAQRCAEWVAADKDERLLLQVRVRAREEEVDDLPELDEDGDSPVNDAAMPGTPQEHDNFISRLVVDPELIDSVRELQQKGALTRALKQVPVWQPPELDSTATIPTQSMTRVSKFVGGKVVPHIPHPLRKRSRYDYESESNEISDDRPAKRSREERALPPEGPDVAIFHPDNKPIRDRLHAQNAFRPPSEFQMPSVSFYEFRNGSQWIAEDDQKLRKLARDHSFNWSIIADQMQLPSRFKSGQERRTPWECFERWVELEQMPAEMRKTIYFKTWYSRLEQSQQAVERRYQAQMAQHNAQAASNTPQHTPTRRRTTPMRVEKRKNTRYLWTVDAMRKNAKKRELAAYKQAEATRAAAQRKASQQNDNPQPRRSMPTPQELSQKRYERDLQIAEAHRQHRQKMLEAQRQAQMARVAQQGLTNGTAAQRQAGSQNPTQQAQSAAAAQQLNNASAQLTPQQRQALMAAQNGQVNATQANGQSVPQAQMQATAQNATQQNLQRLTAQLQARNMQLTPQQQQVILQSAGLVGKNWQALNVTQQAALIAAYTQGQQQRNANNNAQASSSQASASPSMPPPPAPANASQQLSSGHVPALFAIKNMYRAKHPQLTEDQLNQLATEYLKSQQTNQSRQNAINAAAGINNAQSNGSQSTPNMAMYGHNQGQFQNNTNGNAGFNADGTQGNGSNALANDQRNYKMMMHQRQMAQLRLNQGSPQTGHAIPNGSPNMHHASPNMAPVSPNVQFANTNLANQRPSSRSSTPQMQRLGSSGSVPGVALSGVQSPGAINVRGSPQNMHANMAR